MKTTRLFFVVDSLETNAEIFETLEEAQCHFETLDHKDNRQIKVAIVKNSYFEKDLGGWNYEDLSDTFNIIKIIQHY